MSALAITASIFAGWMIACCAAAWVFIRLKDWRRSANRNLASHNNPFDGRD